MSRLSAINSAYRVSDRVKLRLIRLASEREPSDILQVLFYRRDFFGDPFMAWAEDVLRGPSSWTVGEREQVAAFCSRRFHAVETAPISDGLRAAFEFAGRLTQLPDAVSSDDIAPMRAAGLSAEAIADIVHICAIFTTINRIADTVDLTIPDDPAQAVSAPGGRHRRDE